jgi:hypothetical protein
MNTNNQTKFKHHFLKLNIYNYYMIKMIYILLLLVGILGQGLSLSQMIKYNNQTTFKTPFFTIDKDKYILPFKKNIATLQYYQMVLYYDNFLALSYFLTYTSLYYILIVNLENQYIQLLYKLAIPLQSIFDWIENYILNSQIESFIKKKEIKNQYLFLSISSVKWLLSICTFGLYIFGIFNIVRYLIN